MIRLVPKALLKKEWKHVSLLIWAIFIIGFIQFPLMISLKIEEWKTDQDQPFFNEHIPFEIHSAFSGNLFSIVLLGLILGLSATFIGKERNSKRHDFSLALPFSRTSMFMTKMVLGLTTIVISFMISYWIGYFLIAQSEFSYMLTHLDFLATFVSPLAGYFVLFTFTMFIGTFTGDARSQLSLSVIFLLLPAGLYLMIREFWMVHELGYVRFTELPQRLSWPMYLFDNSFNLLDLLVPIIFGFVFLALGLLLFEKAPAERSGEFIVFPILKPFFSIGILVCSFLLGGLLMTAFIPYNLPVSARIIAYWFGALLAVSFAWVISKNFLGLYNR